MPKSKVNYTEITHQVVRQAPEPLPFGEIVERVAAIEPITTRNPKATIRGAIGNSQLIVATGDHRYGWKPRIISGSVLRLTLTADDLAGKRLLYNDEVKDALYPAFFESQKRSDRDPIELTLPDGARKHLSLDFFGMGQWGAGYTPELWAWLAAQNPTPGDHLILTVVDGEARQYALAFQPRSARDEDAIAERNEETVQAALAFIRPRSYGAAIWEVTTHLLSTGRYRHPIPPDPLSEIFTPDRWRPVLEEKGLSSGLLGPTSLLGDNLPDEVRDIFERLTGADDLAARLAPFLDAQRNATAAEPSDLPREYQSGDLRRPRPSAQASRGLAPTVLLRVTHRDYPKVWRDILIAADQTLEDLHLAIQDAYGWDDDHLYSFFTSGRAWDQQSEIGSPWSDSPRHTHQVTIGNLALQPRQKFLYLFDYGDNHEFDVEVLEVNPSGAPGNYPRVAGKQGRAPRQYR